MPIIDVNMIHGLICMNYRFIGIESKHEIILMINKARKDFSYLFFLKGGLNPMSKHERLEEMKSL